MGEALHKLRRICLLGGIMKLYFVEGLYKPKAKRASVEPYAKAIWAENPADAIRIATEDIGGGTWREEPKVSSRTEEQRMRKMGAPELDLFGSAGKKGRKKKTEVREQKPKVSQQ